MKDLRFATLALAALLLAPIAGHANHKQDNNAEEESKLSQGLDQLGLSTEQRNRIEDARREYRADIAEINDRKAQAVDALRKKVAAKASESSLKSSLRDIKKAKKELEARMESFHEKLEDILSVRQRADLLLFKMDQE